MTTDGADIVVTVHFTHYKAYNPSPAHNATGICPDDVELSWTPGEFCVADHNLYFGTSMDDVNESATPVEEDWGPNTYTPTGLELGKTYYWRVDGLSDSCDASPWEGAVWQFTTESGKARDPSPEDEQRGALPGSILSWIPCCVADGQKLYFATDFPESIVLLEDDFESGAFEPNWTNSGWDIWDANDDPCWAEFGEHDHNLARATGAGVKTLTSTSMDTSDYANAIQVRFFVRRTEAVTGDELQLSYYDGSTYDVVDINDFNVVAFGPNETWYEFTDTITDTQYMINNFGIRLTANLDSVDDTVWIDDVRVANSWPIDPNWFEANLGASDNNYTPALSQFVHYYWRVDTVVDGNLIQGDFWDFTTGFGGLIMYYKFNGNQGSNLPSPITDDSGNGIKFTRYLGTGGSLKYGESNPVIDESTASADFDPCVGLYRLDTGDTDPLRLDGWQYTIELWVNPDNLDESLDIDDDDPEADWLDEEWDLWLIGKFDSWRIGIEDPGENNAFRWEHAGNGESMFNDSAVVGEWVHIAAVYDRTNENEQRMQFYLDGVLEETTNEDGLNPADNNYPVTMGYAWKDDVNVGRYFDGLIDEVRIYDIALTPCEFLLFPGPEWASCPNPSDGETEVDPCTVKLMWTPGEGAVSHNIYFSSDFDDVNESTALVEGWGPNSWTPPSTLGDGTIYYWRIDTYDNGGPPYRGIVWQFTTKYVIKDAHLILWYKLDEKSGDTAVDASGYGHHGDVDEEDNWEPDGGQFDGCLLFDDDQAVEPPPKVTTKLSTQVSISVWLNGLSGQRIRDNTILDVSTGEAAPYAMRVLVPDESGDVYWRAGNDSNDALVWDTATPRGWRGDWHHFVFIKDEDADVMQIYFDAELVKDKSGTLPTLSNLFFKPFKIGAYTWHSTDYEGRMDDLRIYDYAIPESKVLELFRGGDLALAWKPSPYDGQPDAPVTSVLIWKPGNWASSHEVYFGTNKQEVEDANNSWDVGTTVYKGKQDPNTYDPGLLELGQSCYWRIDEVNDTNDERWKGKLWRFRVADYITIDDMEDYAEIWDGWYYGSDILSNSELSLWTTAPLRGDQTMKFTYDNSIPFDPYSGLWYFSEAETIEIEPNDWDAHDVRVLSLWFYGESDNATHGVEPMYVYLEDNSYNSAMVKYGGGEGEHPNDITIEEWQEWSILLSSFSDVNLGDVRALCIGFGEDRFYLFPGGYGEVYFDDIRLYQPTCILSKRPAAFAKLDLDNDCIIGFGDIEIMAKDWLDSDVNLGPVTKPDANGLVGWWKLDEAAADTNIATDYAGYDNNGVIETLNSDVWWAAAGHDGNALEFDGGRVRVQDAEALRPVDQVSVCAWVFYSDTHEESARVVCKGPDNKETFSLEVGSDDKCTFLVRDGNDPNADDYPDYAVDSNELDQGEWVHLAGTYDGNSVKCYVNGSLEGTNNDANAVVFLSQDTNDLAIGNRSDAGDRAFIGMIDDVRVYDYALSLEDVRYIATDGTKVFSVQSIANLYNEEDPGERAVNFRDFAVIADSWLEKKLWPE